MGFVVSTAVFVLTYNEAVDLKVQREEIYNMQIVMSGWISKIRMGP